MGKCAEEVEHYRKRGYDANQRAKGPRKEAEFPPVFILMHGFKVQGAGEE